MMAGSLSRFMKSKSDSGRLYGYEISIMDTGTLEQRAARGLE